MNALSCEVIHVFTLRKQIQLMMSMQTKFMPIQCVVTLIAVVLKKWGLSGDMC